MAIILPPDIIKEIAQNFEAGMNSWYHLPTGEILTAPDRMKNDFDEELWEDAFNDIDEKAKECIAFEGLESREEFKIMESFAENEVSDPEVRSRLIYALNQWKPFMHFKSAIHYEDKYLNVWYAFKLQWYMDHVQEQLDVYNSNIENENNAGK